eukprot:8576083-Ditylum_brightwellii.AAC.1
MKLRDERNPLLPRSLSGAVNMGGAANANDDEDSTSDNDEESEKDRKPPSTSEHAQRRERKRFLK